MKTDERMAERITHLERDIKILKNEVQAVLVDLRDKYLEANNPFEAPSAPANPQQVLVLQAPAASDAKPGAESYGGSEKKEVKDKIEEPAGVSEAVKDEIEKPVEAAEAVKDKAGEPARGSKPAGETHPGTARGEVAEAQIPEEVPVNIKTQRDHNPDRDINLIRIVGLVNWAEESVKKLGHQKTEAIFDVAELMGLLSPQLKQIMTKLIKIDNEDNSQSVSARVFLDSLVRITTLLGKDNKTEAALLSILSKEEDDHG